MIAMMKFDLPALKFWESGRVMKMERASDSFWLSIRNGFPINSQMFPVSLTGHQRQQSAVMPTFDGGTASNDFPSAERHSMGLFTRAQPSLGQPPLWTLGSGMFALVP